MCMSFSMSSITPPAWGVNLRTWLGNLYRLRDMASEAVSLVLLNGSQGTMPYPALPFIQCAIYVTSFDT